MNTKHIRRTIVLPTELLEFKESIQEFDGFFTYVVTSEHAFHREANLQNRS
jgi:hypothetical protein